MLGRAAGLPGAISDSQSAGQAAQAVRQVGQGTDLLLELDGLLEVPDRVFRLAQRGREQPEAVRHRAPGDVGTRPHHQPSRARVEGLEKPGGGRGVAHTGRHDRRSAIAPSQRDPAGQRPAEQAVKLGAGPGVPAKRYQNPRRRRLEQVPGCRLAAVSSSSTGTPGRCWGPARRRPPRSASWLPPRCPPSGPVVPLWPLLRSARLASLKRASQDCSAWGVAGRHHDRGLGVPATAVPPEPGGQRRSAPATRPSSIKATNRQNCPWCSRRSSPAARARPTISDPASSRFLPAPSESHRACSRASRRAHRQRARIAARLAGRRASSARARRRAAADASPTSSGPAWPSTEPGAVVAARPGGGLEQTDQVGVDVEEGRRRWRSQRQVDHRVVVFAEVGQLVCQRPRDHRSLATRPTAHQPRRRRRSSAAARSCSLKASESQLGSQFQTAPRPRLSPP